MFVNGKNFDALQLASRTLWEVKTDNFDTYPPDLQRIVLDDQVPELQHERALALACGFNFRVACGAPRTKPRWNSRIADSRASSSSWSGAEMPATQENDIAIIVYAPALVSNDARPLAVVHGMERAFPGLRLGWTISREGKLIRLPQCEAWLAQGRPTGRGFRLICNGDESYRVTVSGWDSPAGISPGGQVQFEVHAVLPLDATGIAAAVDVLEAIAEGARAFWGHATPFNAGVDIARQTKNLPDDLEPPPRGLPVIKSPSTMRSPGIPHHLGWLNYWSDAAARAIGFPDPARDAELLSRSRRTATGGWVVSLTDAPLDLDNPAHLDTLERAYERFREIGGRSTP